MPLKGFICLEGKVDASHFDHCTHRNGRTACPPWIARAAMLSQVEHAKKRREKGRTGLELSATKLTECPRAVYLKERFDYWVRPARLTMLSRGTAGHKMMMDNLDPDVWYREGYDKEALEIEGVIGGESVVVNIDALKKDISEIVDAKFRNDHSIRWRKPDAKQGDAVQLNTARIILDQQDWAVEQGYNADAVKLTVWDHSVSKNVDPLGQVVEHMDESELLACKAGTTYTATGQVKQACLYDVEDRMGMFKWAREEDVKSKKREHKEEVGASLPLVGETMYNGAACENCDVGEVCRELVRKFGRPDSPEVMTPRPQVVTTTLKGQKLPAFKGGGDG